MIHTLDFEEVGIALGEDDGWHAGTFDGEIDVDHEGVIRRIRVQEFKRVGYQWHRQLRTLTEGSWIWKRLHDALVATHTDAIAEAIAADRASQRESMRAWMKSGVL